MKGCLMGMGGFVAVVFGVVLVAGLWVMSTYNGIVSGDQAVKSAWGQVENVYQRRLDLIPNLVDS